MSYKALYRQFRPKDFNGILGQSHIVTILKNQIIKDNTAHAYLFSGTRGTGKTSTAKIFSRAVNCPDSVDGNPCNKCKTCLSLLNGTNLDVVEMDAASNNSVDDIRDLKEKVKYPPSNGKYKVYIIDEVHMLSKGAFNALLKTLEEPPEYLIFILATTEPQKLPATILSRCQRYDFKRINTNDIVKNMNDICQKLNCDVEQKALNLIARNCDGAMRDALSILDQCISLTGEKLTYDYVLSIMGAVNNDAVFEISDSIISQDLYSTLKNINNIINDGKDIGQFIKDLIMHFRNILICKAVDNPSDIIDLSIDNQQRIKQQCSNISVGSIERIINLLSEAEVRIKKTTQPRVILEVTIIKILNPEADNSFEGIISRIDKIEKTMASGEFKTTPTTITSNEKNVIQKPINEPEVEKVAVDSSKETIEKEQLDGNNKILDLDINNVKEDWKNIIKKMKKEKIKIFTLLSNGELVDVYNSTVVISFNKENEFFKNALNTEDNKKYVEEFLSKNLNSDITVKYIIEGQTYTKQKETANNKSLINKTKQLFGEEIVEIK
ncbi:DNA polymerase III subunit gamma/tau [Abyssisolibacter fermentans]|uniref:DNA polymerase III subunit gamma/tau n=1 Tax=Abyssisolibacter fermentans TaxID=1766203 RepID=UPI00083612C3|nr:DNA polymerase III subunit gamma/tau [Abyssisolibacter fermentans]